MIMEAGKSPNPQSLPQFESEGQQVTVEAGRAMSQSEGGELVRQEIFSYSEGGARPSTDWRPTLDRRGRPFYSVY